jgi:hypothetical protein
LFVFPDVNPDGKIYSQSHNDPTLPVGKQDRMWWRKNRNPGLVPNGDDPIYHRTGVDVNRNFGLLWDSGIGTIAEDGSGRTHNLNYPGIDASKRNRGDYLLLLRPQSQFVGYSLSYGLGTAT